jgi:CheY-like chemotaxis protein
VTSDRGEGGAVDLALLHHSALPKTRFSRRPASAAKAKPWIAFGFGAARCAGAVDGVIDGAVKPSHLASLLAEVLEGTGATEGSAKEKPRQKIPARKLRILLVEDNHVNQRVAARILKRMGHEPDLAADGVEAVAQVQARAYDVVLMDMQMPRMDGLDATRTIRALASEAARVPIVAMTANAFSSDRDACFAAGMDDFISKPVNRDKLFDVLEYWSDSSARARPDRGAPSSAASASPVDRDQLRALREELGEDLLQELLASFRTSAADLMAQTEAAIARDERTAADELLHRLKGSAATLSFAGVAQACDRLRRIVRSDGAMDAGDALAALLRSLQESEDLLRPEDNQAAAA